MNINDAVVSSDGSLRVTLIAFDTIRGKGLIKIEELTSGVGRFRINVKFKKGSESAVDYRARGRGKRGGVRIIYYWHPADQCFYMLLAYAKSQRDDLTPAQLRVLRRLVKEEFG